jgi:hypothetical protein
MESYPDPKSNLNMTPYPQIPYSEYSRCSNYNFQRAMKNNCGFGKAKRCGRKKSLVFSSNLNYVSTINRF